MRIFFLALPALLLAGAAVAQDGRPSPAEPQAKVGQQTPKPEPGKPESRK